MSGCPALPRADEAEEEEADEVDARGEASLEVARRWELIERSFDFC